MEREWHEPALRAPKPATRQREQRIAAIGRRQLQLIRHEELVEAGLSPRGIRSRVAAGSLHRIHRGVFSLTPQPISRKQALLAAVLACGPGSVLSDLAAIEHLELLDRAAFPIDVSNEGGTGRTLPGIRVHRRTISPRDIVQPGGIPCTSATRTVFDCSAFLDPLELEELLLTADSFHALKRTRLEELLTENRGARGTRTLRSLVTDDPIDTRSENERRMFRICIRFGVEEPLANYVIVVDGRRFIADFCWPALGLIVEADSWRWHGGRRASESDADRDQLLALAGWRVVRFTRNQIRFKPDLVGQRLAALTTSARLELASGINRR